MSLHEFFRGRPVLSGLDHQLASWPRRSRRTLSVVHAAWVASALLAVVWASGCQDYNPNLGATPTQTSLISLITPQATRSGGAALTLTVNGSGFASGYNVVWYNSIGTNGTSTVLATTFVSTTQITAVIPASMLQSPGTYSVNVVSPEVTGSNNSGLGNNLSNFMPFYVTPPAPTLSTLAPSSASAGGAAFTLQVNGTGFINAANGGSGSFVIWNGSQRTTTVASSTQLSAQIMASDIASAGTASVSVTLNPGPGGISSNTLNFTINPAPSAIPGSSARALSASASLQASPAITAGPRYVAFVAALSGADGSATPGASQAAAPASAATDAQGAALTGVFLRDTCQGAPDGCTPQTTLLSVGLDGTTPNGSSHSPAISADGRFVAFASDATNLIASDENGVSDIFLRDTCIGAASACTPSTVRLSLGPADAEANGPSAAPAISPDGRFIAFDSQATNLTLDPNPSGGAFLRDTCLGVSSSSATPCVPATTRLDTSLPTSTQ